jgi:septal ring factor EnvC (AmiA/AmiB activator)
VGAETRRNGLEASVTATQSKIDEVEAELADLRAMDVRSSCLSLAVARSRLGLCWCARRCDESACVCVCVACQTALPKLKETADNYRADIGKFEALVESLIAHKAGLQNKIDRLSQEITKQGAQYTLPIPIPDGLGECVCNDGSPPLFLSLCSLCL